LEASPTGAIFEHVDPTDLH